jgi:drug/metabolite transporter (DMT)-like permease
VAVTPVLLGLSFAFCFGTSDYLSKEVAVYAGAYRTTVYALGFSALGGLVPALVLKSTLGLTPVLILVLGFTSTMIFLGALCIYKAYGMGALSLTAPVANAFPAVSVIVSILILGAVISTGTAVALILVIVGAVLISTSVSGIRNQAKRGRFAPGVKYAMLAALFLGLGFPAFAFATEKLGYLLPMIAFRGGSSLIGFAAAPLLKQSVRPLTGKPLGRILVMSFLEVLGVAAFSVALVVSSSPGSIPILSTLGGMGVAFTVAYAVIFLKERLEINHVVGIALLMAGVLTLLYFTG